MKKEYLIGAGLIGAAIGFMIGADITRRQCKESINKEVKNAINNEVKNNTIKDLDLKEIRKEVKEEAIAKVANSVEQKTDKKLKEFDERIKVMEDIDAKKLDVAKTAVIGIVTISTTLIKAIYDNRKHSHQEYVRVDKIVEFAETANSNNELFKKAFGMIEERLSALEVK